MEQNNLMAYEQTVIYDENNDIFVQPLCDLFGINYLNQQRFIKNDHILCLSSTKKYDVGLTGKKRKKTTLSREGFIRWIMILNPHIICEDKREKFKEYQKDLIEFLYGDKSIISNTKTKHSLKMRNKEIDREINKLMLERSENIQKIKQLDDYDHRQLGLQIIYDDKGRQQLSEPFHKKIEKL